MFRDLVPDEYRKALYRIYAIAAITVGALAVAHVETGAAPDVLVYVGGALGLVAASNTGAPTRGPVDELDDPETATDVDPHPGIE